MKSRKNNRVEILTHYDYIKVTIPFMISTVTQPLLGAVDTAVTGMLGDAASIAGVSLGANLFNTLYWVFGFLRVSTTGNSAQVRTKGQGIERTRSFFLPLIFSVIIAVIFLVIQKPILMGYLRFTNPEIVVVKSIQTYYKILIWGAPFVLINYVMLGWLMGQAKIKASLFMQISGNTLNMLLDYWFAISLNMGVKGVALATLISQGYTFLLGIFFIVRYGQFGTVEYRELWEKEKVKVMIRQNRDLLLRTICLVSHNNVFAAMGARLGTNILAANSILVQITSIQSYLFDGVANGSSIFAGTAVGTKSTDMFQEVVKKTKQWAIILAIVISLIYISIGKHAFILFTSLESLLVLISQYQIYSYLYPLIAAFGLTLYGLYTGSGDTKPIFLSTAWALIGSLFMYFLGVNMLGNNALWLGFLTFYGIRSVGLVLYMGRLNKYLNNIALNNKKNLKRYID